MLVPATIFENSRTRYTRARARIPFSEIQQIYNATRITSVHKRLNFYTRV